MDDKLAELMKTVQTLKDRQDILDCIQRECRARDRQDEAQITACWWEDGVDEHGPVITRAAEYAAKANMGHKMNFHMTSHNITNHICELDGDTAYCESYVIGGLFWLDDKTTTIAFGRYLDQMERRHGEWRMLTRKCTIEMTGDTDPRWVYSNNVKGFLKARWDGKDPSYERPYRASTAGLRW
ncbi:nuclear transport factor 2 family protein [Acidocella sp.]|uniref:nuclear transport factor 2 family protein n=1 Tax=Acidocella sp. TaxID=50710 RepID=UPI0026244FBF|nr:nuclear transport factor 2 family protein [Acidocella sp.]